MLGGAHTKPSTHWALVAAVAALAGCAEADVDADPEDAYGHGAFEGVEVESKSRGICDGRYIPSASVAAAAARQDVTYEGARRCVGRLLPGAEVLGEHIKATFPTLIDWDSNDWRRQVGPIGGYNCRTVTGGSTRSMHGEGRALDIFIPPAADQVRRADNTRGDVIAGWLIQNAEQIGVQSIIWDRSIWSANRDPQLRCYDDPRKADHADHIHVELTKAAADGQTPFFTDGPVGLLPPPPAPAPQRDAWVGDPCASDAECTFTANGASGRCFLDHRPANGAGFCTLDCEGFCPDRSGRAPTFCASRAALGGRLDQGTCAAKSGALNQSCRSLAGYVELEVERFIGRSGASPSSAVVCAPSGALGFVRDDGGSQPVSEPDPAPIDPDPAPAEPDPPPADPDPAPVGNSGGLCGDPTLPAGDNGWGCDGVPENTWRCACSETFSDVVSQVCRDGQWHTYRVGPRNCADCSGSYGRGCED